MSAEKKLLQMVMEVLLKPAKVRELLSCMQSDAEDYKDYLNAKNASTDWPFDIWDSSYWEEVEDGIKDITAYINHLERQLEIKE